MHLCKHLLVHIRARTTYPYIPHCLYNCIYPICIDPTSFCINQLYFVFSITCMYVLRNKVFKLKLKLKLNILKTYFKHLVCYIYTINS